ncbi:MAG: alpha/beta hydrolase [Actinomycetota bacterium]
MSTIDPELAPAFKRLPATHTSRRTVRLMRTVTPLVLRRMNKTISMDGLSVETVPTPGSTKDMKVYRRIDSAPGAPVLLWIHGGGYVIGTNANEQRWAVPMIDAMDCVVVAAGYRLAPEHPYPGAIDDLSAAAAWIVEHGPARGMDPSRMVVGGESAGGGLAAALVQKLHDDGVAIRGQLLACPMLDDRTATRTDIEPKEHMVWSNASNSYGWSSYLGAAPGSASVGDYAVPARREDLSGLPPAWIGVGDIDLFHDENVAYAERLRAAGVACELLIGEGGPHGYQGLVPEAEISRQFMGSAVAFTTGALAA